MKIDVSYRLRALWLVMGWLLVTLVAYVSLVPAPPAIDVSIGDKVGHILAYATLMLWFLQLYPTYRRLLLAISFVMMGVGLEVLQGLIPSRSLEYLDMVANVGGVALGWLLGHTPLESALITIETRFIRMRGGGTRSAQSRSEQTRCK